MVEQIVTPRNFIVNIGFASVDNEFSGVTICSTTLSAMCYLYNVCDGDKMYNTVMTDGQRMYHMVMSVMKRMYRMVMSVMETKCITR